MLQEEPQLFADALYAVHADSSGSGGGTYEEGQSYFDFEASEYSAVENDGELEIRILRHGEGSTPANVALKAADFLSVYGQDYEILLDGKPLSMEKGATVSAADFTFDGGESDASAEEDEPATETESVAGRVETDEIAPNSYMAADIETETVADAEAVTEEAEAVADDEAVTEEAEAVADAEGATEEAETVADAEGATEEAETVADAEAVTEETEAVADAEGATEEAETVADDEAVTEETEAVADAEGATEEAETVADDEAVTEEAKIVADGEGATEEAETVADGEGATEEAETVADDEAVTEEAETVADDEAVTEEAETVAESTPETLKKAEPQENSNKKAKISANPLRDAQREYLQIPEDSKAQRAADSAEELFNELHTFFQNAQGAQGIVYFAPGVRERTLSVRVIDNDDADGDRMFLLGLLGTDTPETTIAVNATTYVTIEDDENRESAVYSISSERTILSPDNPSATVKVRRSGGTQYFGTAFLSTVKETALSTAYEKLDLKPVGFTPGQSEAEITVTALDFTDGGEFGLRLETQAPDAEGNNYITFVIEKAETDALKADESAENLPAEGDDAQLLAMASGRVLGSSSIGYGNYQSNSFSGFPGGWATEITGGDRDNRASVGSQFYIAQYDKNKHSMIYSRWSYNFSGVYNIRFSMYVGGDGSKFTTYFETDSDQSYSGSTKSYAQGGKRNWKEDDLNVSGLSGNHYIKFANIANAAGKHNPKSTLDWFRLEFTRYNFDLMDSCETFNRKLYDFSSGTPSIRSIYYDGESSTIYNPGRAEVHLSSASGALVSGFYRNANHTIVLTDANHTKNQQRGIVLKGVYFTSSNKSASDLYKNGSYRTNSAYYVAARDGQVSLTLNESFHKTLINYGVISGREGSSATIRIYPVYQQENVEIHFENADRNDANAAEKGKYDAAHLASYIANVIEASGKSGSGVSKQKHDGWLDFYKMNVPKNSVIRVKAVPAANRTANGVVWWAFGSNTMNRVYYERGQKIVDPLYSSGQTVAATDYTMADVIASQNLCIRPNTGNQTLYVGYSPRSLSWAKGAFGNSLQGAIVDVTDGAPDSMNYGVNASNADGALTRDALLGGQYAMLVNAPQGYYTSWADMTGDNGNIEQRELTAQSNKSKNPRYVYGNRLFVKLDQDSTRYYYQFLPVTNVGIVHANGRVLRRNNTLLRLANNQQAMGTVPIAGAYVNVAGFTGQTSADGSYDVELKGGLSDWGNVSVQVTPPEGNSYAQVCAIERVSDITLDALERFSAKSVKAAYESAAGVTATGIAVQDDTLTVTTEVYDSAAIQAVNAHFSFYNRNGLKAFDCDGRDGYTTTLERKGNYLRATLTFNPKREIQRNYRLYVSFEDQTGARYAPIDVGYQFTTGLTLKEFLFPMLGSSSLEGAYNDITSAIDILGDPLSNLDLGSLPGMSEKATDYQPVEDDDRISWMNYDYTFGWSKEFSKDMQISLSDTVQGDEQMNSIMKDLQSGNAGGADAVGGGFEASASFNFSITPSMGFRLRVSLRDIYDENGKRLDSKSGTFFEDLVFYFKVKWGVTSTISIATPVGINILIDLGTDGDIAGVYHMYMDYTDDDYHDEYKLPFDSENFGIFKKFSNDRVRREGYLFANPAVTIGIGAEYCGISVTCDAHFNFDTDFRFTAKGVDAYGDLTFNLTWSFKAFGFTLYSLTTPDGLDKYNVDTSFNTVPIFHTQGVNGHINFDYEVEPTLTAALSGALRDAPAQSLKDSRPTSRAYLDNRSAWRQPGDSASLLDAQGSTESELRKGAAEDLKIQLTPIGDNGNILMVFVDDAPNRTDINKRAVYYSVYTASNEKWSEPAILYDDGTADDYPSAQDLGDGRIFVAWSSVETVMDDDATLEETLQATNIQAAFFDTASRKFGPVENLTHTTDADYTADLMPRAAYDPDTERLILYYTKTEYDYLDDPADMGAAFSLIAYLFYEDGTWSNTGDAYTPEELSYFENPETYKENWYGQRFLETRLNLSSDITPRVAESSASGYHGLALFAYVVDWDDNLATANDRDVFLQIYNFSEDSFSHIIRVTEESGAYSLPTLVRSDNGTYLFYGEKGQAKESGCIRYLNVSYVIQNELYQKITQGDNAYYVLRATRSAVTTDSPDGEGMTLPAETVAITADKAVNCGSLSDFDAFVSSDGRMYLLWAALNPESGASDIYASILNSEDESPDEVESGSESQAAWSDAVALTDGGQGAYYSNLDVVGSKNGMIIVSGKGQFMDDSANSMAQINHTPYSKLALDEELTVDNPYAAEGDNVNVTATLRNAGLDTFTPNAGGVNVIFRVNGEEVERIAYDKPIPGGTSVEIPASVEIPGSPQTVISVECEGFSAQKTLDKSYVLTLDEENSGFRYAEPDPRTNFSETVYAATLFNGGNETSPQVDFTVTADKRTLGSGSIPPLESKERGTVEIALDIPDEAWIIDDSGMGALAVSVEAVSDGRTVLTDERTLSRLYDAEAVALLKAVTDVEQNKSFTVAEGNLKPLEPVITGADGLTVDWQYSDNGAIAGIDYSNAVYGVSVGTTTIHGMVTPKRDVIEFNKDGDAERVNWTTLVPSNLQIPVTAQVTVTEAQTRPGTGYAVTFDSDGGSAVEARTTNDNGLVAEPAAPTKNGYAFDGWYLESGTRYDFSTPLTGDTILKARWKQSSSKAGCYVATSVYGSYDCPEVWTLRRFRDEVLAETWYGRLFIKAYYALSPTAIKLFGGCGWFQSFWRGRLDKLVAELQENGFDATPYEDVQW